MPDVVLAIPRLSVSFPQREAAGFVGKKSWLLVPEQTATVPGASRPLQATGCKRRLLPGGEVVNWIWLARPAVY